LLWFTVWSAAMIIERLSQEHRNIEMLLAVLERELEIFDRGDRPDYEVSWHRYHGGPKSFLAARNAISATQCISNPVSGRSHLKTGIFQILAGNYRLFRAGKR
jgi:hypothetical protein